MSQFWSSLSGALRRQVESMLGTSWHSWALRRQFYKQASSQLSNGVTITKILEDFRGRLTQRGRTQAAASVHQVLTQVRNGNTLMEAMGDSLSDLERSLLAAGERSGSLANAMKMVMEVMEMTIRMRRKLKASFVTPAVYLVTLYAVLYVIGDYIVPQLAAAVPTSRWTGWAKVMHIMGNVATGWAMPIIVGALAVAVLWCLFALPRLAGPTRVYLDRHIFPFTVYREVSGFSWLLSFAALIRAGVPDTEALNTQIEVASPWLASCLRPVRTGLKSGQNLAAAMRRTGSSFPSLDLIDEVAAYVGFGDFPEKIQAAARDYAGELEDRIARSGTRIAAGFTMLTFLCFIALQLGANAISELMSNGMTH